MYSISISSKVYFLPLISCIKNKGVSFKYDKHLYTSKMLKVSSDFQCYKFEIKNKVLIVDWMNGDDKRRLCFHRFGGFFFSSTFTICFPCYPVEVFISALWFNCIGFVLKLQALSNVWCFWGQDIKRLVSGHFDWAINK